MLTTRGVPVLQPHGLARPRGKVVTRSIRFNVNLAVFSDNEGPGSGKRHPPNPTEPRMPCQPPGPAEHFDMLSAEEMESKFPEWIHASTPPQGIVDREPPGFSALHSPDAGPTTGHRRPPSPTAPRALASPPLPYPTSGPAADLQRDLQAKKRIIPS